MQIDTWGAIAPLVLIAALALVGIGAAMALAVRWNPVDAFLAAPALGVTGVLSAGVLVRLAGLPWTPLTAAVPIAAGVGLLAWLGRRASPTPTPSGPADAAAVAVGLLASAVLVAVPLMTGAPRPTSISQLADTSFHLSATRLLAETQSGSLLDAGKVLWNTPFLYPGGFHVLAASLVAWLGVETTVAAHAVVLVAMALIFPASLMLLTRTLAPGQPAVTAGAGAASSLFMMFPFFIGTFGPTWSNMLSTAMIPLLLALLARLTPRQALDGATLTPTLLLAVAVTCGIAGAQPNGLYGAALLGAPLVLLQLARQDAPRHVRVRRMLVAAGGVAVLLALTIAFPAKVQFEHVPGPGPELMPMLMVGAMIGYGVWEHHLGILAVQLLGLGYAVWRRRWWPVVAFVLVEIGWFVTSSPAAGLVRHLSWPWWHTPYRILALAVIPATVLVGFGVQAAWDLARARGRAVGVLAGALTVGLLATGGWLETGDRVNQVRGYYQPEAPGYWFVTPDDFTALRELGGLVPAGDAVAVNPWVGGEYLHVASGRRPLFPQSYAALRSADADLLGRQLAQISTAPAVCEAAQRLGVTHVITGGRTWRVPDRERPLYQGLEGVPNAPGFTRVATSGAFTLYALPAC